MKSTTIRSALAALHAVLCLAVPASAATLAERSPFTQGQWADPTRPGNGFELFSVGNQAMALWFTFEENRSPVWYTAQGEIGATWTLTKHHWNGLTRGASVPVGTLRIDFLDDSQADAVFTVHGREGTWRIEPFTPGVRNNEVDHSGSYYDPANPGWGYTLTEQGDVVGGVLYTYNPFGFPTWVAGFARDSGGSVGVVSVRGPCPGCAASPIERFDAGRIDIEFLTDRDISIRPILIEPGARGIPMEGVRLRQIGRPAADRIADRTLARFPSAASLRDHLVTVMDNMAFIAPRSANLSPPDSYEPQVRLSNSDADACDLVRGHGRYVYTFGHDAVWAPMAHLRVAEVVRDGLSIDVRPETIPLSSGFNTPTLAAALCSVGDLLVSVTGTRLFSQFSEIGSSNGYMRGRTYVEIFSLADPARPLSRWWAEIEGHVLSSFRIGERLYLVTRYAPRIPGYDYRFSPPADAIANREVIASAPFSLLIPQVRPFGGEPVALVEPEATYLAPQGSRRRADFISVVAIDLRAARIVDSVAIIGPTEMLHVSGGSLFLVGAARPGSAIGNPQGVHIFQVQLAETGLRVVAAGRASGSSALHYTGAQLRLVGTRLEILAAGNDFPGLLRSVSALPNASRSAAVPLAGAKFSGNRMYGIASGVLGVFDLSDPLDPRLTGALDTLSLLSSVHVLPDGMLVGAGQELGFFGIPADPYMALYDVRDPAQPREVQRLRLGTASLSLDHAGFSTVARGDGSYAVAFPARMPAASGGASGIVHLEVRDRRSLNAGFFRLSDLRTPFSLFDARALIFPQGVIYIDRGRFWQQDNAGNTNGPF